MTRQIFWFLVFSALLLLFGMGSFLPGSCSYHGEAAVFAPTCTEFLMLVAVVCVCLMVATTRRPAPEPPPGEAPPPETALPQGGGWGKKTYSNDIETRMRETGFAAAPELQRWLEKTCPSGTQDDILRYALMEKGYSDIGVSVYKNDPTICSAVFQPRTIVFWKADAGRRVVWTKAFQSTS